MAGPPKISETRPPIDDLSVAARFDAYPDGVRERLLDLRAMILETAAETPGVGLVHEALKWGQPSFLTPQTGSGSTIRIDAVTGAPGACAIYFHCQTDLVATFRRLYPDAFDFEGNRALKLAAGDQPPKAELKHCIALALTYHLRKKAAKDEATVSNR